jgi:ABC-2 type transport system permease protein
VNAGRAALSGDYGAVFPDLWWVIAYACAVTAAAILAFMRKMNGDHI